MLESKNNLRMQLDARRREHLQDIENIIKLQEALRALKYDNKIVVELQLKDAKTCVELRAKHDRLVEDVVYYKEKSEKLQIMFDRITNIIKGE
jgi:SAM-dependent MidA family methyltransferase